jgi:hypothetical protein
MSDLSEAVAPACPSNPSAQAQAASPEGARLARLSGETPALRSPEAEARAARLAKFEREQLIVDYLNRAVSVAEIATRFDVGEKRMRAIIREIVARRMPHPPEEFVAIQVSRLNEALLVAYSAMSGMNLKAVDRVVRIVRELDRYHGFVCAERRLPKPSRRTIPRSQHGDRALETPDEATFAAGAARFCRAELAPGDDEAIEGAPGATMAAEAARGDRLENLPQGPEILESAPGIARASASLERSGASRQPGSAIVRPAPGQDFDAPGVLPDTRPEIPPQAPESIESAPGTRVASTAALTEATLDEDASPNLAPAHGHEPGLSNDARLRLAALLSVLRQAQGEGRAQDEGRKFAGFGRELDRRPENLPQRLERIGFAPGSCASRRAGGLTPCGARPSSS